jgi:HK97 family phage prohead protease
VTTERRSLVTVLEVREASGAVTLTGYASTFGQPYSMGWYTEVVDPSAFTRTLSATPDVRLLLNHDGLPLARTSSGTMRLSADSRGLRVDADLEPTDPDVMALIPKMKRGDLNQMSFAFNMIADEWSQDCSTRTLRELDLNNGDVSLVTYPANPNTSVSVAGR